MGGFGNTVGIEKKETMSVNAKQVPHLMVSGLSSQWWSEKRTSYVSAKQIPRSIVSGLQYTLEIGKTDKV